MFGGGSEDTANPCLMQITALNSIQDGKHFHEKQRASHTALWHADSKNENVLTVNHVWPLICSVSVASLLIFKCKAELTQRYIPSATKKSLQFKLMLPNGLMSFNRKRAYSHTGMSTSVQWNSSAEEVLSMALVDFGDIVKSSILGIGETATVVRCFVWRHKDLSFSTISKLLNKTSSEAVETQRTLELAAQML